MKLTESTLRKIVRKIIKEEVETSSITISTECARLIFVGVFNEEPYQTDEGDAEYEGAAWAEGEYLTKESTPNTLLIRHVIEDDEESAIEVVAETGSKQTFKFVCNPAARINDAIASLKKQIGSKQRTR